MSYSFFGQLWVLLSLVALGPACWVAQRKLKSARLPCWLIACLRTLLQLLIVLALVGVIWGWQQRTESGRQGFRFDHQIYLLFALLAVPIIWMGQRSLAVLETPRRWTALVLRLAVLSAFVMLLAGLQGVRRQDELTVVALMDLSESVRRFSQPPVKADDSPLELSDWAAVQALGESCRPE